MTIEQKREVEVALIDFIKKATALDENVNSYEVEQIANVVEALIALSNA